ncbi:MAG: lipopolysaccharide heptosyltransferase II [Candidatus Omnitrophota bacterium]
MKRILIIEVNWVGDVLFTTPAIRAIRENNPNAFIGCLTVPRCVDMLKDNPCIDEIIVYDEEGHHNGIFGKISLVSELKKKRFDTVISFHRSMSRMLIAALAGIPRRIGYSTKKRFWLLTDSVSPPSKEPHRVEYFVNIVKTIGMNTKTRDYEFYIPENAFKEADEILKEAGIEVGEKFFVINPGGNWLPKRWPKELYGELCKGLKSEHGMKIVITGAEKDIPLAEDIISMSSNSAVSICGKTTLKELAAVMKRASVVISNDSGPMHISVSQRTPTVAIFGPTSPSITGPYGSSDYIILHKWHDCRIPCYAECSDYRCMEAISVDDVVEAVKKMLSKKQAP